MHKLMDKKCGGEGVEGIISKKRIERSEVEYLNPLVHDLFTFGL